MRQRNSIYSQYDLDAAKILSDFLPDKIFDAHSHFYKGVFMQHMFQNSTPVDLMPEDYFRDMNPLLGNREIHLNMITWPDQSMGDPETGALDMADSFLKDQLDNYPHSVGEILVLPNETPEQIEYRLLSHPRIRGLKCYHYMSGLENSWQAEIGQYLPESAWQVADKHNAYITLHMVRDGALSDEKNLDYIQTMAQRYPNATLILAHAARAFAAWTGVEAVDKVADLDNVWFDFSAVCESPAIFQILNKTGTERSMWGSDYDVARLRGKAISLGDSFYWIYDKELAFFSSDNPIRCGLIGTENLMAVRQACIMAGLGRTAIENIFYKNAAALFYK